MEQTRTIDQHVGARLHAAIMASRLDAADVAREIGVSRDALEAFCAGRARIDAASLYQAARLFGIEVSWFFEGLP